MCLFQAPLDSCLGSPFFASLSVHSLHFTVYAPSMKGSLQKGRFDKACALTCRFLCRSPAHRPKPPHPLPLSLILHRQTTPHHLTLNPSPRTPIGTRTPFAKTTPGKKLPFSFCPKWAKYCFESIISEERPY